MAFVDSICLPCPIKRGQFYTVSQLKFLCIVYLFIYLYSSIGIVAAQPRDFATSFLGLLIVNYLGSLLFLLFVKVKDYVLLL